MVLVVDDNDSMRKLLVADLTQGTTLRVEQASTGAEGLQKAASPECAVVVLDMMLPDTDGLQFIERLRELRSDPPSIIAITGASQSLVPDAIIEGPYRGLVSAVFRKPIDRVKLRETVVFCAQT
jgi:CheY-like chemotaxis protein